MTEKLRGAINWVSSRGFVLACVVLWGSPAAIAEEIASPAAAKGYNLSEKLCSSCHLIDEKPGRTTKVGPPSFRIIANQPGQTADRIRSVLIKPHPPMPDIHLSNEEILNILAYMQTLRTDKTAPPLVPPEGSDKPKAPART